MNNKSTIVMTSIVFALVGTMIFAAVAPYLATEVDAKPRPIDKRCNENSPNGGNPSPCGGLKR